MVYRALHRLEGTPEMSKPRVPWDRLPSEGDEAWEAFITYLTMGTNRSLAKVGQALGKSKVLLEGWSREHSWVNRVSAYETEQGRIRIEAAAAERQKTLAQQADVARALVASAAKLVTPSVRVRGRKLTEEERWEWKPSPDAARAAASALKEGHTVTRLTMGLPTQITRQQSEAEELVRKGLEAQGMMARIINEGLCDEPSCECCTRVRDRLAQLAAYHAAIEQSFVGVGS
jgi:hypothetical protein